MMAEPVRVLELRSVRGTGGGPEKTILLGTARTDATRYDITVCYLRAGEDDLFGIDTWARQLGVKYDEIRERHSLDPAIWRAARKLVRDHRIQIVHSHEYKTNLLAWLLAKSEGVIPLSTVHGWTGHSKRERLVYYPFDKRLLIRFPRLITVSTDIRDELVRHGGSASRMTVVLNGIDHNEFHRVPARCASARAAFGIRAEDVVVGAVGRLEPQKRFDLLLQAVATLRKRNPAIRLLIVGEGSLRSFLEQRVAQLDLQNTCRLVGHCSDVAAVHHAFDLFVQSSDYEGTPNAVLEAMALETPIVATDVGGTSELVTDGVHGLVVPPGNVRALVEAIDRALAEPALATAWKLAARLRVERELSFERRMKRIESIYDELMDSRGAEARQKTA